MRETFEEAIAAEAGIGEAVRADLSAVFDRDPACHSYAEAFLYSRASRRSKATVLPIGYGQGAHGNGVIFQSRISDAVFSRHQSCGRHWSRYDD